MLLREKPSSWLVLSTVLLLAAATTFAAHSLVPVFGWDVLDFWAPRVAFKSDEVFRHSDLIPSLLRFLLEISNATVLAVFLSVLLPLAIALLVNDILVLMHISTRIRALAVYGVVTIPLLENHAAIRGYSEIWVVLLLLLGTSGYLRLLSAKKIQPGGTAHAPFDTTAPCCSEQWSVYPCVPRCSHFDFRGMAIYLSSLQLEGSSHFYWGLVRIGLGYFVP